MTSDPQIPVQDLHTSRLMQPLNGRVLVDDELPNRLYLRKLLEGRGCEVFDADDAFVDVQACVLG